MGVIAEAAVKLSLAAQTFTSGLRSAEQSLNQFGARAQAIGTGISLLGAAAVAPLVGIARGFANAGDEAAKMAARTGLAVETITRFSHAAGLSDVSMQQFEGSARFLQRAIDEARQGTAEYADEFERLGITMEDLEGKTPDEQLMLVFEALADVDDQAVKTGAAMALFGRSGTALFPMLAGGAAGLREMLAEADALGVTMSGDTAHAAEQFNDNLFRLRQGVKGIVIAIGTELVPWLDGLVKKMPEIIKNVREWVANNNELVIGILKWSGIIGGAMLILGPFIFALGSLAKGLATIIALLRIIPALFGGLSASVSFFVANPMVALVAGIAAVVIALVTWFDGWRGLWEFLKLTAIDLAMIPVRITQAFLAMVGGIINAVGLLLDVLRNWAQVFVEVFLSPFQPIVAAVGQVFSDITGAFVNFFAGLGAIVVSWFTGLPGLLSGAWASVTAWVSEQISNLLTTISGFWDRMFEAGARLITAVWDGMKSIAGAVKDWFAGWLDALTPDAIFGDFGREARAAADAAVSDAQRSGRTALTPVLAGGGTAINGATITVNTGGIANDMDARRVGEIILDTMRKRLNF